MKKMDLFIFVTNIIEEMAKTWLLEPGRQVSRPKGGKENSPMQVAVDVHC